MGRARILVVTNMYPPHHYGGYELLCEAAVEGWRAMGHEVDVLTSDWRRPDVAADAGHPSVSRTLPLYWADHEALSPSPLRRLAMEGRTRQRIGEALAGGSADVVSVWNLGGLSLGVLTYVRRRHLPVVLVIADEWLSWGVRADAWARMFANAGRARRAVGQLVTRATGLSTLPPSGEGTTVCFASRYLARRAQEGTGWQFDRTAVVPYGVDLASFPPVDEPTDRWTGRLLVVARLDPRKGIATVVRALAHVPDVHVEVVGGGDERHGEELVALAGELGVADRFRLVGERDRAGTRQAYLDADALVFPSEWQEPFGIVPLEAMACGLPVIGTGTGGSGEFLVDEETCLRFTPGDEIGLAEAVTRLAADPDLRMRLRRSGLRTARALSQQRTIADLATWHQAAAEGFGSGTPDVSREANPS